MKHSLHALYGLKWNPFSPSLPIEAMRISPKVEDFCWRIENVLRREGGFALLHGDPGTGKSMVLRLLAERLEKLPDATVGVLCHPQSSLVDFYREMGEIFGVDLRPSNRWGGFKSLRERWLTHLEGIRLCPVLLIDEAQELSPALMCELRLLSSARFDSKMLLCVVLAGDARLPDRLRCEALLPLGSRIRVRMGMEYVAREELAACLEHLLTTAGNAALMTAPLKQTLCDHALGNYRVLTTMCAELLNVAMQRQITVLDEKLYFEVFAPAPSAASKRRASATR